SPIAGPARPARWRCTTIADCGHRLPEDSLDDVPATPSVVRVEDVVAPRTVLEAVLEGRRAALIVASRVGQGAAR
ncbi:MAG: 2,4-dienoyl-CoA reductase, partial [Nocardioides sp.]|nr:2,4-dienoyl-CoA reductase [Nocardioides sp.]